MTKVYSRYKRPSVPGISGFEHTLAQQQFRDETNINLIVERAARTGDMSVFTPPERQQFIDTSVYEDYQSALHTLETVEDDFYSLPASVRKEFDNDPQSYVAFMSDDSNYDKAVELGLLHPSGDVPASMPAREPEAPAAAPPEANPTTGDA